MRRAGADRDVQLRLELEWELWVVEHLLAGARPEQIVETLVSGGTDREIATEQVDAVRESARFAKLRRRVTRAYMAEQALRLHRTIAGPIRIDVVDDLDRSEFHARYWLPSRPVLLTEATQKLGAVERWSLEGFREELGDLEIEVNSGRTRAARKSATEKERETMRLGAFIDEVIGSAGNERYIVSKNGLLARPELRHLEADLVPLPAFLDPPKLPSGVSLWLGPAGTFSPAHFDPHGVLLVQVAGRKRVRLVPPDQLALVEDMDGYYARPDLDDDALHAHPEFDPESVVQTILERGHALFVPAGWFHEITALEPSLTLSFLTFPWDNHFHWLRPLSSTT
jgi:hypothetical protein